MKLERESPERIKFSHSGRTFTRLIRYFLIAIVLMVIFGSFFSGQIASVLIVLLVAGLFWKLADYVNVESHATFDHRENRLHVVQSRAGTKLIDRSESLDAIENVVIQSSNRSGAADDTLKTRPALVIMGETVPLTFASFASGRQPTDIALELRSFLNLPESDLVEDSIVQALKGPVGTGPAVRLARLGKGMGRLEAAGYVRSVEQRLEAESTDRQTSGGHEIRRERS